MNRKERKMKKKMEIIDELEKRKGVSLVCWPGFSLRYLKKMLKIEKMNDYVPGKRFKRKSNRLF